MLHLLLLSYNTVVVEEVNMAMLLYTVKLQMFYIFVSYSVHFWQRHFSIFPKRKSGVIILDVDVHGLRIGETALTYRNKRINFSINESCQLSQANLHATEKRNYKLFLGRITGDRNERLLNL